MSLLEKISTSCLCCRLFDRQKSDYQTQSLDVVEPTFVQNLNAATAASLSSVQAMTPLGCMLPPKPDMRQSPGSSAIGCTNTLASSTASFRQQPPPMKVCFFTTCSLLPLQNSTVFKSSFLAYAVVQCLSVRLVHVFCQNE